jgi:hypothetical protein
VRVTVDGITVRAYEPGDEASILDLFVRAFHQRRDLAHWRWKYQGAPYGNLRISLAVDPDGRVVAHYAGYPVPFRRDAAGSRETLLAYQIGDTMTLPEARGVGRRSTSLLARTARHFYDHFCAGQVAFNYGFNVGRIQRFSVRSLNATRVEAVPFWSRERAAGPRPAPGRWRRLLDGLSVEAVERVDEGWDEFFGEVAPAYGFLVHRDARYVRWRYLQRPDVPYLLLAMRCRRKLVGWGVFARRQGTLVWGDALVHPDHRASLNVLLDAAAGHPMARGVRRIQGWFSPRPAWFTAVLVDLGFRPEPEPQDLGLMCVPWLVGDAADSMQRDLYYTYGDSDLF